METKNFRDEIFLSIDRAGLIGDRAGLIGVRLFLRCLLEPTRRHFKNVFMVEAADREFIRVPKNLEPKTAPVQPFTGLKVAMAREFFPWDGVGGK